MDPLQAGGTKDQRPSSWVGFDEISMTTPAEFRMESRNEEHGEMTRDESLDMDSGRESVATEERLDVEDNDRPVITPLPTNEMIVDASKLGSPSVVTIQQEYADEHIIEVPKINQNNARVISTIYPENNGCAWITPPRYDPSNVPKALQSGEVYNFVCCQVPRDDFITAMQLIINDYRFRSYTTLYSRLITFWLVLSIIVLLAVLFSNSQGGLPIMLFCLFWIFMLFAGIIGCAIIKKQIRVGLRHCVQSANKILLKHNILAGVEDRGQLSCHKVVIHLIWFSIDDCLTDIQRLIRIEASGGAVVYGGQAHAAPAKEMGKKEVDERAMMLMLKYSQDYVKDCVKHRLLFPTRPSHGVSEYLPKHCSKQQCLCQFVDKNHFNRTKKRWYSRLV